VDDVSLKNFIGEESCGVIVRILLAQVDVQWRRGGGLL
jgi:hypothetical protein